MLTLEQIQKYTADIKRPGLEKFALVEYLQCEMLDSLFRQKKSEKISFIGGTATRIVYGGTRFSEDLDFDNFGLSFSDFDKLISNTRKHLEEKGFEIEIRLVEKGAYHCYLKFPKILYNLKLSPLISQKILVKIDMNEQKAVARPAVFYLNRFGLSSEILTNPAEIILAQKMIAAIERRTPKGRDFFDISFLYGFTKPDFSYIKEKLKLGEEKFIKKFITGCKKLNFAVLARDVTPFLLRSEQIERVTKFPKLFKEMVEK